MCDRGELIVGYVYDELSSRERQDLETHLAACAACRVEVEGIRATRGYLSTWRPPEADLGFRVIRGGAAPAAARPRRRMLAPALGLAAAAVLVLAAAAAVANIEIRYGGDGSMTLRTGWAAAPGPEAPGPATEIASGSAASVSPAAGDFAALDRRLREIEATLESSANGAGVQMAAATRMSDAEILRRVRQLVSEAEARQETVVAQRLLEVVRDFDQQRRADIALIQQGLGQYQGLTNAEIAQNRDMLNQLVRAATRQER